MFQLVNKAFEVVRSRPATTADDADAVLRHELEHVVGERFGLERVDGLTVDVEREACVGDA